jgi:hypothetical protein
MRASMHMWGWCSLEGRLPLPTKCTVSTPTTTPNLAGSFSSPDPPTLAVARVFLLPRRHYGRNGVCPVMHAKFMHEFCSLLMHIPTYLNVMRCYNHASFALIYGDFLLIHLFYYSID